MAKIQFGMMMTDARGKLGGQVFSKNRGGAYIRTKVTPSNPQTADQQANRSILTTVSQGWSGLSGSERESWNSGVNDWTSTNVFGNTIKPSGKNLYASLNKNLLSVGEGVQDSLPPKQNFPALNFQSATADLSDNEITLQIDANSPDYYVVVSATPPLSAGTSNAKSKFRRITSALGDSLDGATIYANYVAKFGAIAIGQNIQFEVKLIGLNGQMTTAEKRNLTIVA